MFGPEAPYERGGDVKDVVFPCGQTIGADGDTIYLYYGAGGFLHGAGHRQHRSLLAWLEANSSPTLEEFMTGTRPCPTRLIEERDEMNFSSRMWPSGFPQCSGSGASARAAIRSNSSQPSCVRIDGLLSMFALRPVRCMFCWRTVLLGSSIA